MRRKDKEITDRDIINAIMGKARVCRLGLSDKNRAYIVPLSFGYDGNSLYFHGFPEGKKIDILRKNSAICFELDSGGEPIVSDKACSWSVRYKSVIGYGKALLIEDVDAKMKALEIIMRHYSEQSFVCPEEVVDGTAVIRVDIETVTAKISGCA